MQRERRGDGWISSAPSGAWQFTALLKRELFQITPHDPATLAGTAMLLFAAGVLACWLPSRRVERIDPVRVLRAE